MDNALIPKLSIIHFPLSIGFICGQKIPFAHFAYFAGNKIYE